jgi:replicative DNA helicase
MIAHPTSPDVRSFSQAVEQGVLGCLLLGAPIPGDIQESAFLEENHKVILESIVCLAADKIDGDLMVIATSNRLRLRGMLDAVGGLSYLEYLTSRAPSSLNLDYWLPQLKDLHGRRVLKQSLGEFMVGLDDPNHRIDQLIKDSRKTLDYIAHCQNGKHIGLTVRDPEELLNMKFDDSDCVLGDRLIAKGQNSSVCGPSSVGKSRLILQQAVATITGRQFVGLETRGTGLKWLFLQAENSNRRFQFDLKFLKAWVGPIEWVEVVKCLKIHTLETDSDGFLQLDSHSNLTEISRLITDGQPDIIVFDCLYNFQIGDLNKDSDMAATLLAISRLVKTGNPNRIPIVLHHALTGKAGAAKATGYDRASFGRNSKVLHAWTRGQINVSAGAPDNNDTLVLSCGKCSNGREFPSFAIHINHDTRIYEPLKDFDISSWESDMNGVRKDPTMSPHRVRELCPTSGSSKQTLVSAICQDCFCSRATAYRHVENPINFTSENNTVQVSHFETVT